MATIGKRKIKVNEIESTHSYLMNQIDSVDPPQHGDAVLANFQTSGRGMDQNHWESLAGKNLLVSFFIRPDKFAAETQFYLNMAVSLSVLYTVEYFLKSKRISIKWPNDIYVDEKKIAGILISHSVMGTQIEHSVVSVGLNVNQHEFFSGAPNPVSIIHHLNREIEIEECQAILINEMNHYYSMFIKGQLSVLYQKYIAGLLGFNQWREYNYKEEKIRARIVDVLPYGLLELEDETGNKLKCNFKEIEFVV